MKKVKKMIKRIEKRFKKMNANLRTKFLHFFHRNLSSFIPVDNQLILFMSFLGRGYSDSPKALYEYMKNNEEYSNYKCVWVISNYDSKTPYGDEVVKYFSLKYFYYLAKSKYWFFNAKMPSYIKKKENQIYLQTWHGTPLKKLGNDIEVPEGTTFYASKLTKEQMCETYNIDSKRYTYMVSPNPFSTEKFQSAFNVEPHKMIETGYPRNDFITNITSEEIVSLKNKYNIPLNKKVILYAPTWRDNSFNSKGQFTFELKVDFNLWKEILGDEYIVIFKPHYLIVNKCANDPSMKDFIYSISAKEDINNLYVVSDALITDYSSVFFDYANLKRPMYFYMYDLEEYANDMRGFYLDIHKDLPSDIYKEESSMLYAIKNDLENKTYDMNRLEKFNERFNLYQDGNSCKKVLDIVLKDSH